MTESTGNNSGTLREFTITRVFDASRELIWDAFTDPTQLIRFFGPEGTSVPLESVTIDPQEGGTFALTMVMDDGSAEFGMNAVYKELVEPERMVFQTEGGITGTIELNDLGNGKTEFKWTTNAVMSDELLEHAQKGTNSTIDLLGRHLESIQV